LSRPVLGSKGQSNVQTPPWRLPVLAVQMVP
jgi:hypothetical protein